MSFANLVVFLALAVIVAGAAGALWAYLIEQHRSGEPVLLTDSPWRRAWLVPTQRRRTA
ncbi:MAG: hypothetical protein RMI94_00640 [Bryobacterales bacterium]|nr:hypothetical protein [Bryobacterales bacterium]